MDETKLRNGASRLGIAFTSCWLWASSGELGWTPLAAPTQEASRLLDHIVGLGGSGVQLSTSQLSSFEPEYLLSLRRQAEASGLFIELSHPAPLMPALDQLEEVCRAAKDLGAGVVRITTANRRYEEFHTLSTWRAFVREIGEALSTAESIARRAGIVLAVENHKDWLSGELLELLESVGSPHVQVCLDIANNLALLEEPYQVAERLARWTATMHLKDIALHETVNGFEMAEVPLGQGVLDLRRMLDIVCAKRPAVALHLEMITRDPLHVPWLDDAYWSTFLGRESRSLLPMLRFMRAHASPTPLPRVAHLNLAARVAIEEANVRASLRYAREVLEL